MKDCGFNYYLPTNDASEAETNITLEESAKTGIKVLINDFVPGGLYSIVAHSENKTYDEVSASIKKVESELITRYKKYAKYTSFAGIQIRDEPAASFYDAIAAAADWWYENFPDYEFYANLLPSYASYVQLFGASSGDGYTFNDYVESFIQKTNPAYISYDNYPYIRSGFGASIRPNYLPDLETFAINSKKFKVPFYCYQLISQHWTYTGPDTYREYAWQVYTALAYGCQGFQTFKYWDWLVPNENADNCQPGLTDQEGNIQPIYYAVQQVNKELTKMQDLFLSFSWEGTMPLGGSGSGAFSSLVSPLESIYGVKKVEAEGDALIGQFRDKNSNRAYFVANYISPYLNKTNKITMDFINAEKVLICKKGRKIVEPLSNHQLTLEVGSGEGFFVIPIN